MSIDICHTFMDPHGLPFVISILLKETAMFQNEIVEVREVVAKNQPSFRDFFNKYQPGFAMVCHCSVFFKTNSWP